MLPVQPNFLAQPFAVNGARNQIPATADESAGVASLDQGFPNITELPIKDGGLPPQRKDFNGILHLLSTFCMFAQSGGIFAYSENLDYTPPCMISYNNRLYICKKQNGKGTDQGVKIPDKSAEHWQSLIGQLLDDAEKLEITTGFGVPIGTVLIWPSNILPQDGSVWLECNGQSCVNYPELVKVLGKNTVPNYVGRFLEGGTAAGTRKEAGLPNITGRLCQGNYRNNYTLGAFYQTGEMGGPCAHKGDNRYLAFFDASRSNAIYGKSNTVQPASETVKYIIKAK